MITKENGQLPVKLRTETSLELVRPWYWVLFSRRKLRSEMAVEERDVVLTKPVSYLEHCDRLTVQLAIAPECVMCALSSKKLVCRDKSKHIRG